MHARSTRACGRVVTGDTVNTASRLNTLNRFFGTRIVVSEAVLAATEDEFLLRPLGRIALVGKTKVRCVGTGAIVAMHVVPVASADGCSAPSDGHVRRGPACRPSWRTS